MPLDDAPRAKDESTRAAAGLFACCWSLATLFHLARSDVPVSSIVTALSLASSVAVYATRGGALAWGSLAVSGLLDLTWRLPLLTGSEHMTMSVYVAVLAALASILVRRRSLHVSPEELYTAMRPILGGLLIWVMVAAVFFKLNSDFLKPELSSAPKLYDAFFGNLNLSSDGPFRSLTPVFTVGAELLMVVAFLSRGGRGYGVVTLWGMWLIIGVVGIITFSSKLYALSIVFLSETVVHSATASVARALSDSASRRRLAFFVLLVLLVTLALVQPAPIVLVVVFVFLAVPLVAVILVGRLRMRAPLGAPSIPPLSRWGVVLLCLMVAHESLPFIRLKDWPTYRLYCDLHLYSCASNHLIFNDIDSPLIEPIVTTEETWQLLWSKLTVGRRTWESHSAFPAPT